MAQYKRGRFISIEGIEGVGKSTVVKAICAWLSERSIPYVLTREPGGTPIAEAVRQVLLSEYEETMCPDTELLLMFAGRAQNIAQVILPALEQGQWVLSDRFTDASFAYQGGGRGIAMDHIEQLAQWVQGDLKPDMTLLLDAPVSVGLSRVKSRGAKDRIENEGAAFFERVRNAYLALAKQHTNRYHTIDATQAVSQVQADTLAALKALLEQA